jgi:AcrR family transcriptional regulator
MMPMSDPAQKRAYHSPRRQEQAQVTRRKIVEAADRLFTEQGYAGATLAAIAAEAGVAPATVTAVFGTKFAILEALIRTAVRGDDAPAPLVERSWWQEMLREPDPARRLWRFAAIALRGRQRTAAIAEIVRGAAGADPELAALRRQQTESRLEDMRSLALSLDASGALRPGLTVARATDLLWALGSAEMYQALVVERGWAPAEYETWLATTLIHALLDPAPA